MLVDPAHDTISTVRQHGKDPNEIGEWRVGRKLGAGSNGRVRIARHMKSGEYAAIKILSKHELDSQDADPHVVQRIKDSIMREIVFMKVLHHPNILRMYDAFITRGNYYLILEYVDGDELFNVLGDCDGLLPLPEALNYFQQIVIALAHCHRFNIAHRDLKPENILLCKNGVIKLADFGLAGWMADNGGMLLTQCGSPHYLAPEVVAGENEVPYDGRAADVWSAGMILYSLLTNEVMFHSDDHMELFEFIIHNDIKIPSYVHPDAQDILLCMLERDVDERYTIEDVQVHPFFELATPPNIPKIPTFEELAQPLRDEGDIDPKIFGNLRYLWPSAPANVIRAKLLGAEKTWEQAVYQLL
ncbi:Pkinase-domain-containing protein, partial [Peniophora sp. CONT]